MFTVDIQTRITFVPSLSARRSTAEFEKSILRELIAIQPNEFREDKTVFEQLVRMQHYGLPTRLLDLTYNPLVGLFFACWKDAEKDGEFLRFRLRTSSILKYFDSDTVSCVANLVKPYRSGEGSDSALPELGSSQQQRCWNEASPLHQGREVLFYAQD